MPKNDRPVWSADDAVATGGYQPTIEKGYQPRPLTEGHQSRSRGVQEVNPTPKAPTAPPSNTPNQGTGGQK